MKGRNRDVSTFDHEMEDPKFRISVEREEAALEVSEFMAREMAQQDLSVRRLSARSGISPTVIQGIKTGKRKNIEYTTLRPLVSALGFRITFKKLAVRERLPKLKAKEQVDAKPVAKHPGKRK